MRKEILKFRTGYHDNDNVETEYRVGVRSRHLSQNVSVMTVSTATQYNNSYLNESSAGVMRSMDPWRTLEKKNVMGGLWRRTCLSKTLLP